jgi:hypothetical protein
MAEPANPRVTQLRGTSDQLLLAIQTVALLEQQKRGVPVGDDRFPGLAKAVREAAEAVLDFSMAEEDEADRIHDRSTIDVEATTTIAETPPASSLAAILEEWRAVERRLAEAPAGSPEAADLLEAFERLRSHYAETLAAEGRRAEARDLGST